MTWSWVCRAWIRRASPRISWKTRSTISCKISHANKSWFFAVCVLRWCRFCAARFWLCVSTFRSRSFGFPCLHLKWTRRRCRCNPWVIETFASMTHHACFNEKCQKAYWKTSSANEGLWPWNFLCVSPVMPTVKVHFRDVVSYLATACVTVGNFRHDDCSASDFVSGTHSIFYGVSVS